MSDLIRNELNHNFRKWLEINLLLWDIIVVNELKQRKHWRQSTLNTRPEIMKDTTDNLAMMQQS